MPQIPLKKKIAQMFMVGFDGYDLGSSHHIAEAISKDYLGGVILFDLEEKDYRLKNIKNPEQVEKLTADLQSISDKPLLIGVDYEGGYVNRLKEEYSFPKTFSHQHFGKINDPVFTYEQSIQMGSTLKKLGININFAPVVDLNSNPKNPIIAKKERSFSGDAEVVSSHARQFIKAQNEAGILSCIKHFPGHGSSASDSHLGFVDISDTWDESEYVPYRDLIEGNLVSCVMTAHVFNRNLDPEYPATLSKIHIDHELRDKLGFGGVVFSDDLHMGAVRNNYSLDKSLELAINAGVDVLLMSYSEQYKDNLCTKLINIIINLVEQGKVSENRINESYNRIKILKNKLIKAV